MTWVEQDPSVAAVIAQQFHEAYETLAPRHGYKTREASAKPWTKVPDQNKALMIDVVQNLLDCGIISPGEAL